MIKRASGRIADLSSGSSPATRISDEARREFIETRSEDETDWAIAAELP